MATKAKTQTIVNIKMDKELKAQAQEVVQALGITMTTAANAFFKQLVRERKIELSDERNLAPTPYLERVLTEAHKELENGEYDSFDNMADAIAHLKKL